MSGRHQRSGGMMAFLSSSTASKSSSSNSKNAGGKSSSGGRGFFGSSRSSCSSGSNDGGGGGAVRGAKGSHDGGSSGCMGDASAFSDYDYYGGLLEMDENDNSFPWGLIHHSELANMLNSGLGKTMVIDSRSFLEYNTSNIQQSVNVCGSKLVKRRLQQDKVHVVDLLNQTCNVVADSSCDVIVYDQCTEDPSMLTADNFVHVLLRKLSTTFNSVAFLKGGFLTFQASHSNLVENKSSRYQCSTLTSLSQPCMPVSNVGPTRILSFLYLGSQQDSMAHDVAQVNGITYILNVSKTCPRPPFILEGHFYRIPVNDNYCEKLLPYFPEAFQFLDKVREANGCVLVHCLGGVSRSATLAIAYIMKHMKMSSDEAYRYVKDKRPTISPNFNFLGQLLQYEKVVRRQEAEEDARKEILKAGRNYDDDGLMDAVGRASPSVMDLHTSSPSSPGPRAANKSFSPLSDLPLNTIKTPSSTVECPFPGPESVAANNVLPLSLHNNQSSSIPKSRPSPLTTRSNLVFSTSEEISVSKSCDKNGSMSISINHGIPQELCPFPGPSYANPAYSHNPNNLSTTDSVVEGVGLPFNSNTPLPVAKEIIWAKPQICNISALSQVQQQQQHQEPKERPQSFSSTPSNASQAAVCPLTGFPSPGGDSSNDQSQSICTEARFLSSFPHDPSSHAAVDSCSTYQSENVDSSSSVNSSLSVTPLPLNNKIGQSKSKASFLSSVFSGFRRRSRPPTLSLGSPVAHPKTGFSSLGEKILGPQLTPVSEASENNDLNSSENNISDGNSSSSFQQTNSSDSVSKIVSDTGVVDSSHAQPICTPANTLSPSQQTPITSSLSSASSNELPSSKGVTTIPTRIRSVKLNPRNFFLSLSSPTSDFFMSSSMPCLSSLPSSAQSSSSVPSPLSTTRQLLQLQSPGDSKNKRKSGIQSHQFDSPDKFARTEDLPSKAGHGQSSSGGKTRQRPSIKKPTFLTLSSPTAAMANLNFSSPSNPSKDFPHSMVSAEGQGKIGFDNSFGKSAVTNRDCANSNMDMHSGQKVPPGIGSLSSVSKEKSTSVISTMGPSALTASNLSLLSSPSSAALSSSKLSHSSASCSSSSGSAALDLSSSSISSSYLSDGGGGPSLSSLSSSVLSSSTASSSMNYQSLSRFPTTSLDKLSFTPCSVRDIVQDLKDRDSICKTEDQCSSLLTDSHASSSALDSPMSISSGSSVPSIASSTLSPVETGAAPSFPSGAIQRSDLIDYVPPSELHDPMEHQTADDSITDSGVHSVSQCAIPSSPIDSSAAVTPDSMLSPTSTQPQSSISPVVPSLTSPCDSFCSSSEPLSPMSLDDSRLNSPICSPSDSKVLSHTLSPLTSMHTSICSPILSPTYSVMSPISSTSSMAVSSSSSSLALSSSGPASSSSKVVLRKDKNRRVLDRPNSIAFSSYPTCDLISKASENAAHGGTTFHQDDTSSAIAQGHARRARSSLSPDVPYHRGRTSWGCYSEREVYRQITAAMESAMLRTQAYLPQQLSNSGRDSNSGASRKARSLDNIIDNGEEDDFFVRGSSNIGNHGSCKMDDSVSGGSHFRGKYMPEKSILLEPYHCGMRGGSEPYHSSSSLSSNGSHGSIHSSLEIIQVS